MNVVFLNCTADSFTPTRSGALGTHVWEVCRAAERAGVKPLVITRTSPAAPYDWPRTVFIEYPRLLPTRIGRRLMETHKQMTGWRHPREGAYVKRVIAAIRRSGAAGMPIVMQNDPEIAVALRQEFPRAFIHHHAQNQNTANGRFRRQFASSVNLATAVSDFTSAWNSQHFGLPVRTWYNGVDTERFSPGPAQENSGPPVINFVGRTDAKKAPDLLVRAAIKLARLGRKFSLQLLGANHYGFGIEDEYQSQLRELCQELEQLGVTVRRPGWINRADLPDELRKAQIHVTPSRWDEPFGLTTLEGMACGLATVASATGGTPEVVGDAGFLFPRDGVDELAEHLDTLIADPALRLDYGRRARRRAIETFTWDKVWRRLSDLLTA